MKIGCYWKSKAIMRQGRAGLGNLGIRIVCDALERAGFSVEPCGLEDAKNYDVVLMTVGGAVPCIEIMADLLYLRKPASIRPLVLMGGAGMNHIVPFIGLVDGFCFGRGEVAVVEAIRRLSENGDISAIEGVGGWMTEAMWRRGECVRMNTLTTAYPHEVCGMKEGEIMQLGCHNRCLFCNWSWTHSGNLKFTQYQTDSGKTPVGGAATELMLRDYRRLCEDEGHDIKTVVTAVDGISDRIRRIIRKPVSRDDIQWLASRIKTRKLWTRLYQVAGFPWENEDDWQEYREDMLMLCHRDNASKVDTSAHLFMPMPCTPLAGSAVKWEQARRNFDRVTKEVLGAGGIGWCFASPRTETLMSIAMMRAEEKDIEPLRLLCSNWGKIRRARAIVGEKTIAKHLDIDRLTGAYDWETLPTRYIRTHAEYWRAAPKVL